MINPEYHKAEKGRGHAPAPAGCLDIRLTVPGSIQVAQWIKGLATKPADLSLIPRIQIVR